jgi:hypothetical protein
MSVAVLSTFHVHPSEDVLDEYALGRLPESTVATLEEHILLCSGCQSRVLDVDDFVAAMKTAAAEIRQKDFERLTHTANPPHRPRVQTALWTLALVSAGIAGVVISVRIERPPEAIAVPLSAFRGGEAGGSAHAPAGRTLRLMIDSSTLPLAAEYRLQVVNANGREVWSGAAVASDGKLSAQIARTLRPGVYWVRIYSAGLSARPSGGPDLLREFGLRLD